MKPTNEEMEQIYLYVMQVIDTDDITVKDLIYRAICKWEEIKYQKEKIKCVDNYIPH